MINVNATLFVQIINLLVLIWILNRLMYVPIRKMMAERGKTLTDGLDQAKGMVGEAEAKSEDYRKKLRKGQTAVREELWAQREEAEAKSQALIAETLEKARADYREFLDHLDKEMAGAREDIRKEVDRVAKRMAGSILGRGVS